MTDHERGAYAPPTEGPLTFDARQPVRGARPFPLSLVFSVLVLAGVVAALFWFYRSGVRQAGDPPQVVGTSVGEMKSAAPAEAQPADPAAGLQIYRADEPGASEALPPPPKFAQPPETPIARTPEPKVVVTPPAAAPAAPAAAAPKQTTPAPLPVTRLAPPPAKTAVATPPPKAPEPKAAAASTPPPKAASGGAVVQIGAVASTALADKAWSDAVAAAPGLAAGKGKSVEKVEREGGTLYRTAVTGFADRAAAVAFCDRLKAAGKSCFVR